MDREKSVDGQELIRLINGHSEHIKKCTITCATTVCCHCGLDAVSSRTPFIFHGTRPRRFLVLDGSYVRKVPALLARWRCPRCRKTFTDYPPFACPYKAYTLPQIAERAAKYVSSTATSYRKGVCSANRRIYYEESPAGKSAQHRSDEILSLAIVAHSSLFHWVTALGRDALRQLRAAHTDFAPAPRKYASERRRSILIACQATCSGLLSAQAPAALPGA
jgi:transposase-like protein